MQINFFTFSPVQQVVELALYTDKHKDTHPERLYADATAADRIIRAIIIHRTGCMNTEV